MRNSSLRAVSFSTSRQRIMMGIMRGELDLGSLS